MQAATMPSSLEAHNHNQRISYAVPKPKVSLMANRNKTDHIRQLICGVEKPKSEARAQRNFGATKSAYGQNYVFEEEAKEMVDNCD